ncbi:hypothetical protein RhiirC2_800968 [Rhizophagus irregularis]|uniref:Uncharacterized protein n=1 Tax=Rhizophagus irregularis TaxID=588596 RepID=A0A2N1M2Y3_9GLOM|nr:hypothetical protein RhiirC2_800968 [Rhizophagus irregularis]
MKHTFQLSTTVSWAEIMDFVNAYYNRLFICPDFSNIVFHTSPSNVNKNSSITPLFMVKDISASSLVVFFSDLHYTFYTDGSLITLGTSEVFMGWDWIQIVKDSDFLNSIASYKHSIIHDWPSFSCVESPAIYAALSASPANSVIHIYTDLQTSIDNLKHCFLSIYSDSHLYYKTTNFELWAIIQKLIIDKNLSILPFKVKTHSNFYWNDFADFLANTAHTSKDAVFIFHFDLAAVHDFILGYNDVVRKSNSRHLFKQYHQMLYMKDLFDLSHFRFTSLLTDLSQYVMIGLSPSIL